MPRVKIDYVVSFSSEDPENPASNLLAWDVNKKKWLCSKGEATCSVVLQLAQAVKICSVNIGAYQSALVEVLVGRSETPNEPFQVLVPSSVFQTPSEARRGAAGDADKVRSFGADTLAAGARDQRWDRLRLVCSQPYNKHCKFGVSFVHVFSAESAPAAALLAPRLDALSSDEEEFRPGELFAKHLQKPNHTTDTGAQIRKASSHALKNIPDSTIRLTKTPISKASEGQSSASRDRRRDSGAGASGESLRHRDSLLYTADDQLPNDKVDRVLDRHYQQKDKDYHNNKHQDKQKDADKTNKHKDKTKDMPPNNDERLKTDKQHNKTQNKDDKKQKDGPSRRDSDRSSKKKDEEHSGNRRKGDESRKRKHTEKNHDNTNGGDLVAGAVSSAPHRLLSDVVFVLSGYENPERARLRTAALALGATCLRDWSPAATHLICAFPNTPKLRAVRSASNGAGAAVVRGEWVEQCARTRRRLPWQWWATEPAHRRAPPADWDRDTEDPHSECDTDDEIERVRQKMKKQQHASPPPAAQSLPGKTEESPHGETEESQTCGADVSNASDVVYVRDERLQGSVCEVDSESDGGSTEEEGGAGSPLRSPRVLESATLPALFAGRTFTVHAAPPRAALLARYLAAYGGLVLQDAESEADYVVCDSSAEGRGCGGAGGGVRVRAGWVWRCHRDRALASPLAYTLPPA